MNNQSVSKQLKTVLHPHCFNQFLILLFKATTGASFLFFLLWGDGRRSMGIPASSLAGKFADGPLL